MFLIKHNEHKLTHKDKKVRGGLEKKGLDERWKGVTKGLSSKSIMFILIKVWKNKLKKNLK